MQSHTYWKNQNWVDYIRQSLGKAEQQKHLLNESPSTISPIYPDTSFPKRGRALRQLEVHNVMP